MKRLNLFKSLLFVLIFSFPEGINGDYCPDDVTAGKCFREDIIPFVIASTVAGIFFGLLLLILSLCLFCKTKVKNGEIDWVHQREPSDWVREVQNLGNVNNGYYVESRKSGLGDNKPKHFVTERSLYSEHATTSAFPSSNASDIMSAVDEIQDDESRAPSGYYWTYGSTHAGTLPQKEKTSKYETITSSKTIHSAQILHHKKSGSKMTEDLSSENSTNAN